MQDIKERNCALERYVFLEVTGYSNQGMLISNAVQGGLRKIVSMFSEKKVWGMEIYFVKGKKVIFVLKPVISKWEE